MSESALKTVNGACSDDLANGSRSTKHRCNSWVAKLRNCLVATRRFMMICLSKSQDDDKIDIMMMCL